MKYTSSFVYKHCFVVENKAENFKFWVSQKLFSSVSLSNKKVNKYEKLVLNLM